MTQDAPAKNGSMITLKTAHDNPKLRYELIAVTWVCLPLNSKFQKCTKSEPFNRKFPETRLG